MENKRSKVLISILLVVLCLSVCVGLTYAYFTDSAKSSGNKIQAGNLKLDLELYDKENGWASIKDSSAPVFDYAKWEPGYVDAKLLKIENLGDLAMQWEAKLVSTEAVSAFANAIEVYVQKSDTEIAYPADRAAALAWTKVGTLDQFINTAEKLASGTFTAQGEAYYIGIAFYMPAEITDNTLQGQVLGAFDIQINATQLPYESDAFDESYDADATLSCTHIESDWIVDIPAEEGVEGSQHTECTVCGEQIRQETIPAWPISEFTWSLNTDGKSYTVTGLKNPYTVENLVIPATYNGLPVTAIGESAFNTDKTITSVIIPDGVTSIGDQAFYDCGNLQSISIPDSITYISGDALLECYNLNYNEYDNVYYLGNDVNEFVVLMRPKEFYTDSCDIHENTKIIYTGAFASNGLTDIEIPDGVTQIGDSAFSCCSSLTNIDIPDSVITIGDSAFWSCHDLTSVTIPDSVVSISPSAFNACTSLTNVTIGDSVTTIGDYAFSYCRSLTSIEIPNSVTTIGKSAFSSCSGLTSIEIPNSVTTIGEGAFSSCRGLTSIEIPNSVTTIGKNAFYYCDALTSITFAGTVEQWNAISFGDNWHSRVPATEVVCSDGNVALN